MPQEFQPQGRRSTDSARITPAPKPISPATTGAAELPTYTGCGATMGRYPPYIGTGSP